MNKLLCFIIISMMCAMTVKAQNNTPPPESKPDMELTCEEGDARIEQIQKRIDELTKKLQEAKNGVTQSETDLEKTKQELIDCEKEILRLIGKTEADVEAFRQKLGVLEGKVRQMKNLPNDVLADRRTEVEALEAELNELRKDKLSVIPEFFDKIVSIARDIKGLYREKKINGYTVGTWSQDRDCLWNIASKTEIYGDPFQWPKIWQANTDIIRNPDIIHPGQVLKILPTGPKTDDEIKAERKYWRNKRAAAEKAAETIPSP
jgi:nucleoid-associated protein YgaU